MFKKYFSILTVIVLVILMGWFIHNKSIEGDSKIEANNQKQANGKIQETVTMKQKDIQIGNSEIKCSGYINLFDRDKSGYSVKYTFDEIAKDKVLDNWAFIAVEFTQGVDDAKIKSYAESLREKLHLDMYDSKGNKVYEFYLCGSISSGGAKDTEFPIILFTNKDNTQLKKLKKGTFTLKTREKEYLDIEFKYDRK